MKTIDEMLKILKTNKFYKKHNYACSYKDMKNKGIVTEFNIFQYEALSNFAHEILFNQIGYEANKEMIEELPYKNIVEPFFSGAREIANSMECEELSQLINRDDDNKFSDFVRMVFKRKPDLKRKMYEFVDKQRILNDYEKHKNDELKTVRDLS